MMQSGFTRFVVVRRNLCLCSRLLPVDHGGSGRSEKLVELLLRNHSTLFDLIDNAGSVPCNPDDATAGILPMNIYIESD